MDFGDRPSDFGFKDPTGKFDAHFPHGQEPPRGRGLPIPHLRAGDMVKIMAVKPFMGHLVKERVGRSRGRLESRRHCVHYAE